MCRLSVWPVVALPGRLEAAPACVGTIGDFDKKQVTDAA